MTEKKHKLISLYFWIISIISFFWLCVAIALFATSALRHKLITDEEYISLNYREIENCKSYKYEWGTDRAPTQEEISQCEENTIKRIKNDRNYTTKNELINSWIQIILMLIIFPINFINFKKREKNQ